MIRLIIYTLVFSTITNFGFSQQVLKLNHSKFLVKGTSSIHDWEMTSEQAEGSTEIIAQNNTLKEIKEGVIYFPVKSLKSGKNSMDKNAYEALKEKEFKTIHFSATKVTILSNEKVEITGNLKIAGTLKPLSTIAKYTLNANTLKLNGDFKVSFSEFNLEAPTAVFGTIKTGNDLNISFNLTFN